MLPPIRSVRSLQMDSPRPKPRSSGLATSVAAAQGVVAEGVRGLGRARVRTSRGTSRKLPRRNRPSMPLVTPYRVSRTRLALVRPAWTSPLR